MKARDGSLNHPARIEMTIIRSGIRRATVSSLGPAREVAGQAWISIPPRNHTDPEPQQPCVSQFWSFFGENSLDF